MLVFGYLPVIWNNWAKKGPNIGVAVPQALVGGWGLGPLKSSVTGPSMLINCYLGNKFHKKYRHILTVRLTLN